jgi:hypothetical protein
MKLTKFSFNLKELGKPKTKQVLKVAVLFGYGAISDQSFANTQTYTISDFREILGENANRSLVDQQGSLQYYIESLDQITAFAKGDPMFTLYVFGTPGEVTTIKSLLGQYEFPNLIPESSRKLTSAYKWRETRRIEKRLGAMRKTRYVIKAYTDSRFVGLYEFLKNGALTFSQITVVGVERKTTDVENPKLLKIWVKAVYQNLFGPGLYK